jgi:hypothetical protein
MTRNILSAIERREFHDSAWVNSLMERFADYYFVALEAYEKEPASAPAVWQVAHSMTRAPNALALQKLLVGVNAHINFDLVLSLVDMLGPEWDALAADQRSERYDDHCHVNTVIGIGDVLQDQVLVRRCRGWRSSMSCRACGRGWSRISSRIGGSRVAQRRGCWNKRTESELA